MILKQKYKIDLNAIFLFVPLLLLPLLFEWLWRSADPTFFALHEESLMILDVAYMVIIRFLLLDTMLYTFSHSPHPAHTTLIRIVMLYLEITVVTILYFALVFYLFDVFTLFHFNALLSAQNLESIKNHPFISSFYISAITFTTLGSGEWVPQNIHAMLAVSSEVILGVVQSGVFVAILIYSHQNKPTTTMENAK